MADQVATAGAPSPGAPVQSRFDPKTVRILAAALVVISFFVIFRGPIGDILSNADTFEFETPIGTLRATNETVAAQGITQPQIQGNTFVDPDAGFEIGWPEGWTGDTERLPALIANQFGVDPSLIPIVIHQTAPDAFAENVNVVVQRVGDVSATDYLAHSRRSIVDIFGSTIIDSGSDEETKSGYLVSQTVFQGALVSQVQRFQIHNGRAYVVTATGLPALDAISDPAREQLLTIFNSFRLVA